MRMTDKNIIFRVEGSAVIKIFHKVFNCKNLRRLFNSSKAGASFGAAFIMLSFFGYLFIKIINPVSSPLYTLKGIVNLCPCVFYQFNLCPCL